MLIKLFFILFSSLAFAHQTGLSYIEINEDIDKKIQIVYKKPLLDKNSNDILINYPNKCKVVSEKTENIEDGFIINSYELWCLQNGLIDTKIWIEGLNSADRGFIINYTNPEISQNALLRSTTPFIHIGEKYSNFQIISEYILLGVSHILLGYDHLLFVLALLLLAKNKRALLLAITAFSVSHSITLISAIFGLVNISVVIIEFMIALSIVFLARELLVKNKESYTRKFLVYVAFIFGLLHGFGFSNVLSSIGLPRDDKVLALLSFNIGIELGQLLFIFVCFLLSLLFKNIIVNNKAILVKIIAYFIGIISSYWAFERVLNIL